ncbi:cytochrome c peroxidase [Flavobacterium limnosediminis JC2902]|uniref:Cytochrome c peroxidase n=1 Tax=Flavobacterium limnosediminis JC2902 TaxID=1341181 RepID=V6SQC6_9FLAO|nr:cytochrome c peroxidase [Flavobacterium limnosediminis]ESU26625.1 cytochrome c peroxidase [Flavobacterium limnosediminis JC2902]
MKKIIALLIIICSVSCQHKKYQNLTSTEKTKQYFVENYSNFSEKTATLTSQIQTGFSKEKAQQKFKEARLAYKKTEALLTFYLPETAIKLNGAAIDKNDVQETSRKTEEATGFQKVEELLFSDEIDLPELKKQMGILNGYTQSVKTNIENIQLSDSNIFEAQKLQMVRLMSLGISGFDSPVALHSIPETKAVIESIGQTVSIFKEDEYLTELIKKTTTYLGKNQNFDRFDRADFIVNYCIPLSKKIHQLQKELNIKNNPYPGAINFEEPTIFEDAAFNVNYFAPSYNRNPSKNQIALGEKLFSDTILSGDNKISCASCHIPSEAYADHKTKAVKNGNLSRNTPTLLNSGFQNTLFLDGRVNYLEDQAKAVINNKDEMHGSFGSALKKVKNDKKYQTEFRNTFPNEKEITEQNLLKSLASYIRSLSKLNSKFDDYLRGKSTLSQNEKNGFNLYMGKAKCATCHFFPLFNGCVPPMFNETESEVLGVPSKNKTQNVTADSDLGEYSITKAPLKKHAFKTPTVRNSAITFPYMHNGVYQTLEEVIDFYNRGGGAGIGIKLENQTLPTDKLNLSKTEIQDLIAFIKTLNNSEIKSDY